MNKSKDKNLKVQLQGKSEAPVPTGELLSNQGTSGRTTTETNRLPAVDIQARENLQTTGNSEITMKEGFIFTEPSVISIAKGVVRKSGTTEIDRIKNSFGRQRAMSIQETKKRKIVDLDMSGNTSNESENELLVYKKKENLDAFILMEALESTKKLVKELEKFIEQNTKREVKDITSKLKAQMTAISSKNVVKWLEENKYDKYEKLVFDADTMTKNPNMIEVGTQTMKEGELQNIERTDKYEDLAEEMNKIWGEEIYKNTIIKEGNPMEAECGTVKVVMVRDTDKEWTTEILRQYKTQYPEIKHIKEEISIIKQIYEIQGKRDQIVNKIIKITYRNTREDLFNKICKIKENSEKGECLIFHEIQNIDVEDLRKMIEIIIHGTGITAEIYREKQITNKQKEKKTYALIVETKEKDYQKTMEAVKEKLKNKENRAIIGIRKTRNESVLITMERDDDERKKIENALNEIEEGKIKILGKKNTTQVIYIKGMDIFTTQKDVKKAINKEIQGIEESDIKMSALRPMINGTQAITVFTTKEIAEKLQELKHIKIGMVRAGVYKRIEIKKCNRCWKYDHLEKECKDKDRKNCCYKCGSSDHLVKNCENEEYCPICEKIGHRAGNGKCWIFRETLGKARKAMKEKQEQEQREKQGEKVEDERKEKQENK
ncbi:putative autophagy-related protein 11 [Euwallacea fornicatus]|uniref:putative autophagy-related protein 11 n=1 Tax=Euwallacea fornicatus TaxID=995702 RepID=UPI00338D727E